jgi:hypothetical protein
MPKKTNWEIKQKQVPKQISNHTTINILCIAMIITILAYYAHISYYLDNINILK